MDSVQRARQGLTVFLVVLVAISLPLDYGIAKKGLDPTLVLLLTFSPGFASIVARIAMDEGFGDISFKLDRRTLRTIPFGILYPILAGLPAYTIAWLLGLARFDPPSMHPLGFALDGETAIERMLVCALFSLTVGLLAMVPMAIGEELGWRGYMLTRLIEARFPKPVLISAVVWAAWHIPILASGFYMPIPKPALSIFLFFLNLSGTAWVMAKLRLTTGSVWPAIVLHAAWNSIIGNFFSVCTQGEESVLWASETGVLVAVFVGLTVFFVYPAVFYKPRRRIDRSSPKTNDVSW